jgi:hypothetical protein
MTNYISSQHGRRVTIAVIFWPIVLWWPSSYRRETTIYIPSQNLAPPPSDHPKSHTPSAAKANSAAPWPSSDEVLFRRVPPSLLVLMRASFPSRSAAKLLLFVAGLLVRWLICWPVISVMESTLICVLEFLRSVDLAFSSMFMFDSHISSIHRFLHVRRCCLPVWSDFRSCNTISCISSRQVIVPSLVAELLWYLCAMVL